MHTIFSSLLTQITVIVYQIMKPTVSCSSFPTPRQPTWENIFKIVDSRFKTNHAGNNDNIMIIKCT